MNTSLIVKITKVEKEKLERIALRYGLSLNEFARHVFEELSDNFPAESFSDYESPRGLRASYDRALRDWSSGHVSITL